MCPVQKGAKKLACYQVHSSVYRGGPLTSIVKKWRYPKEISSPPGPLKCVEGCISQDTYLLYIFNDRIFFWVFTCNSVNTSMKYENIDVRFKTNLLLCLCREYIIYLLYFLYYLLSYIFIGPKSYHCLALSVSHSLSHCSLWDMIEMALVLSKLMYMDCTWRSLNCL